MSLDFTDVGQLSQLELNGISRLKHGHAIDKEKLKKSLSSFILMLKIIDRDQCYKSDGG